MLYRLIYTSEAVGSTGTSLLTIAQILGVSERNNRRDRITGSIMFHDGVCLQALEGARVDIDRLMTRLHEDPRHAHIRVLVDTPVAQRRFDQPMAICDNPSRAMQLTGSPGLTSLTAYDAERILTFDQAA